MRNCARFYHLAQPEIDTDAVNKLYVEQRINLNESTERIRQEVDFVREGRASVANYELHRAIIMRLSKSNQKQRQ